MAQLGSGSFQYGAGPCGNCGQLGRAIDRDPAFKHGDVVTRILAGKGEIGTACGLKGGEGGRLARLVGILHQVSKHLIALTRCFGDQVFTAFKVPIDCGGCNACFFGSFRERKARRPFGLDQFQSRFDQRLAQVAVMIAAFFRHPRSRGRHRRGDRPCPRLLCLCGRSRLG